MSVQARINDLQIQLNDLHEHLHLALTRISKLEGAASSGAAAHPEPDEETSRPTARRTAKKTSSG